MWVHSVLAHFFFTILQLKIRVKNFILVFLSNAKFLIYQNLVFFFIYNFLPKYGFKWNVFNNKRLKRGVEKNQRAWIMVEFKMSRKKKDKDQRCSKCVRIWRVSFTWMYGCGRIEAQYNGVQIASNTSSKRASTR